MSLQSTESLVGGERCVPRIAPGAIRGGKHDLPESQAQDVDVQTRNLKETLQKIWKITSQREKLNNPKLMGPPPKPVLTQSDCRGEKVQQPSLPSSSPVAGPSFGTLDQNRPPTVAYDYWPDPRERDRRMKLLMQLKEKDIMYLLEEKTVRWETGM